MSNMEHSGKSRGLILMLYEAFLVIEADVSPPLSPYYSSHPKSVTPTSFPLLRTTKVRSDP